MRRSADFVAVAKARPRNRAITNPAIPLNPNSSLAYQLPTSFHASMKILPPACPNLPIPLQPSSSPSIPSPLKLPTCSSTAQNPSAPLNVSSASYQTPTAITTAKSSSPAPAQNNVVPSQLLSSSILSIPSAPTASVSSSHHYAPTSTSSDSSSTCSSPNVTPSIVCSTHRYYCF